MSRGALRSSSTTPSTVNAIDLGADLNIGYKTNGTADTGYLVVNVAQPAGISSDSITFYNSTMGQVTLDPYARFKTGTAWDYGVVKANKLSDWSVATGKTLYVSGSSAYFKGAISGNSSISGNVSVDGGFLWVGMTAGSYSTITIYGTLYLNNADVSVDVDNTSLTQSDKLEVTGALSWGTTPSTLEVQTNGTPIMPGNHDYTVMTVASGGRGANSGPWFANVHFIGDGNYPQDTTSDTSLHLKAMY
jgi:hypothetical protein